MNYMQIHNRIIDRARSRVYDSSLYQNHHITPLHEDPTSTDVVPLTFKEHKLVHLLRYKMGKGDGNRFAYYFMKGAMHVETASAAGKRGGRTTKDTNVGIFSDTWDRSKETTARWADGRITKEMNLACTVPGFAQYMGRQSYLSGKGIHADDYDRSAASKKIWDELSAADRASRIVVATSFLKIASQKSKELGTNFSTWDKEKQRSCASKGGSIVGKLLCWTDGVSNKKTNDCPGDGWYRGRTLKTYVRKQKNLEII